MHLESRISGRGRLGLLALAVLLPVLGCGGDGAGGSAEATLSRLEGLADDDPVVLACRMKTVPETFPVGEGGTELSRGENGVLVRVPRGAYDRIAGTPGVQEVAVWGVPEQVQKMDFWLQAQVLNAWSKHESVVLSCLARFSPVPPGIRETLQEMGATPRTVAGPVVTLDAQAGPLLDILQMPELVSMTQPRMLTPMEQKKTGN